MTSRVLPSLAMVPNVRTIDGFQPMCTEHPDDGDYLAVEGRMREGVWCGEWSPRWIDAAIESAAHNVTHHPESIPEGSPHVEAPPLIPRRRPRATGPRHARDDAPHPSLYERLARRVGLRSSREDLGA